jgi:hypothetical protein
MTMYTIEITDRSHLDALAALTAEDNDRAAAAVPLTDKSGNPIPGAVAPTPITVEDYIQNIMLSACQGWAASLQRKNFETAIAAAQAGDAAPIKALADSVATVATAEKTTATPPKGVVTP